MTLREISSYVLGCFYSVLKEKCEIGDLIKLRVVFEPITSQAGLYINNSWLILSLWMTQMRHRERNVTQRSSTSCPRSSHGHPRPRRAPAALRKDLPADCFKGVKYVKAVVNTNLCCTNGGGRGCRDWSHAIRNGDCLCLCQTRELHVRVCPFQKTQWWRHTHSDPVPSWARLRRVLLDPPRPCLNCVLYHRAWALLFSPVATATPINAVMTENMTSSVLFFALNPCRDISVGHEAVTCLLLKSRWVTAGPGWATRGLELY